MQDTYVGLDLSLTSTGVAILRGGKLETLRIKPKGKNDREKLSFIHDELYKTLAGIKHIDAFIIEESIITKFKNTVKKMMMVHGVLQAVMGSLSLSTPMLFVHPTTLKRLVTGSGGREIQKKHIIEKMEDITGLVLQNDEADASALAYVGLGVGYSNIPYTDTQYSKIADASMDDRVYKQFGLDNQMVSQMKKAKAKASNTKNRAKKKIEKKEDTAKDASVKRLAKKHGLTIEQVTSRLHHGVTLDGV